MDHHNLGVRSEIAADTEHALSVLQVVKLYRRAISWCGGPSVPFLLQWPDDDCFRPSGSRQSLGHASLPARFRLSLRRRVYRVGPVSDGSFLGLPIGQVVAMPEGRRLTDQGAWRLGGPVARLAPLSNALRTTTGKA